MSKFLIEDVQVGISDGGPMDSNVIAEAKIRKEDGSIVYHCLAELSGTLNFYESEVSTFDGQINDEYVENEEFAELMDNSCTSGYSDYDEFYTKLSTNPELSDEDLICKYLAYLVRADWDETERFKAATVGKSIGEFEIPVCDAEKEFLAEQADEENEEDESEEEKTMNELYKKIYNDDEDEIAEPFQWLIAIFQDGMCIGEYTECEDMSAEEAYKYGLEAIADMIEANKERGIAISPYSFQLYIRPATFGDLEA